MVPRLTKNYLSKWSKWNDYNVVATIWNQCQFQERNFLFCMLSHDRPTVSHCVCTISTNPPLSKDQRSRGPISLAFVLPALQALRPVRRARQVFTNFDHFGPFGPFLNILTIFHIFLFFWLFWPYWTVLFSKQISSLFSGCFDTSGSMIPRLVPEISPCVAFCDEQEYQQELGILGVRYYIDFVLCQWQTKRMDSPTSGNVIFIKVKEKNTIELFQPTQQVDTMIQKGDEVCDILFDSKCQWQGWKQIGNEETNPHFYVCIQFTFSKIC